MYWLNNNDLYHRRPWVLLGVAAVAVLLVFQLRGSGTPFLSPWSAVASEQTAPATGSLTGAFGAVDGMSILGAPTITPAKIDAILASYNSPATGLGQFIYDMGVKYGVDPIFCVAFFVHESTAGTQGVATVTKSVGNIRVTQGYAEYQGFRRYESWNEGIEDWYRLIRELYVDGWKLTTVEQIIPVYAPPVENDTDHYVDTIRALVTTWRTQ